MQKLVFVSAFLALCLSNKNPTRAISAINKETGDTTFIYRKATKDNYCAVYIEKNRQSSQYTDLLGFRLDSDENAWYKENYAAIKKHNPEPYKIYNLSALPKEWVPLYQYKTKYYLYYPSDAGNMGRVIVTDSTINYWYMDGLYPEPIKSMEKVNQNTWCFKIPSADDNPVLIKITIYIIDPVNKIAIWENSSMPVGERYELFVPKEKASNFDMVVNFCRENKTGEFLFDNPDYKTLLSGH